MINQIIHGDIREIAKTLQPDSIDCIITSPPYWGLRDYGTGTWEGGDSDCDHVEKGNRNDGGRRGVDGFRGSAAPDSDKGKRYYKTSCPKCGANRTDQQIGQEDTPEAYVETLVSIFEDLQIALKDTGTLWLNLGDSYAGNNSASGEGETRQAKSRNFHGGAAHFEQRRTIGNHGVKPKDLVGIPWMVAFALRSAGWYLRSDIIWHKPNGMPESVTDRPTKAHEYLYLLSKSPKYYYDGDAIREKPSPASLERDKYSRVGHNKDSYGDKLINHRNHKTSGGVNKRTVWTIATKPYKEAHFAVFPPALVIPCLLAGCPPNGLVLDPFFGSGTVGKVALENGRNYLGVELNEDYIKLAQKRLQATNPALFAL